MWQTLNLKCLECKKPVTNWSGIVCGNFSYKRKQFAPCQMAWHGSCYKLRQGDSYPIAALQDSEELDDPKEQNKFKSARAGDHLMCPFQCDLCHFRNIHKRDPVRGIGKDARLLMAIRRANLDSFWARSEHTVTGNRNGAKQLMRIASDNLGIGGLIFPEMGPHKLEDN